ncbi:MAG: hypothetical protein Kow0047_13220 [Anaerolineae bacterium]
MTYEELVDLVRDALAHLYDSVYLQSHPLTSLLQDVPGRDRVTRAQQLRRLLIGAIERLAPAGEPPASSDASLSYSALCSRYIDGLAPEEIAAELAISPRQVYRKLREGVEAVATLIWDDFGLGAPSTSSDDQHAADDRRSLARRTVEQLITHAQPEILNLASLVREVIGDLEVYRQKLSVELSFRDEPAPVRVYADRTIVRQILMNLLTVSLERAAGGKLSLGCATRANRAVVELSVTEAADVPPEGSRQREGIGWEIARELLQSQAGSLAHHAAPWHVEATLPLAGPHSVLVIDDMADLISLFQRFTTQYSLEVIGATSAAEAWKVLDSMTPSLIMLDVMLPRQDGWEILQRLKSDARTASIPVIICSILNEPGLATALGADGYLRKPVTPEALRQELERWLPLTPAPAAERP